MCVYASVYCVCMVCRGCMVCVCVVALFSFWEKHFLNNLDDVYIIVRRCSREASRNKDGVCVFLNLQEIGILHVPNMFHESQNTSADELCFQAVLYLRWFVPEDLIGPYLENLFLWNKSLYTHHGNWWKWHLIYRFVFLSERGSIFPNTDLEMRHSTKEAYSVWASATHRVPWGSLGIMAPYHHSHFPEREMLCSALNHFGTERETSSLRASVFPSVKWDHVTKEAPQEMEVRVRKAKTSKNQVPTF